MVWLVSWNIQMMKFYWFFSSLVLVCCVEMLFASLIVKLMEKKKSFDGYFQRYFNLTSFSLFINWESCHQHRRQQPLGIFACFLFVLFVRNENKPKTHKSSKKFRFCWNIDTHKRRENAREFFSFMWDINNVLWENHFSCASRRNLLYIACERQASIYYWKMLNERDLVE